MRETDLFETGGAVSKIKRGDKVFFFVNALFLGLLALLIIYPLYFIIIAAISDPDAVLAGKVVLYPVNITWEGFKKVFERKDIWTGYKNTIIYTIETVIL
ncbi:MAG: carbohydrate ABC transporter permease, partial [Lachnospiraceae bacterium]|nr:carbohydrate ABC transporter permease [Lachnospiraceae bacterium]